jgi:hypothetical protein
MNQLNNDQAQAAGSDVSATEDPAGSAMIFRQIEYSATAHSYDVDNLCATEGDAKAEVKKYRGEDKVLGRLFQFINGRWELLAKSVQEVKVGEAAADVIASTQVVLIEQLKELASAKE